LKKKENVQIGTEKIFESRLDVFAKKLMCQRCAERAS